MSQNNQKQAVAQAALELVLPDLKPDTVLGIGTGSTAECFIHALAKHAHKFDGAVSSSEASSTLLKKYDIPVYSLNSVEQIPFYIDGTDEVNSRLELIKGGGGALTREKIIAACARQYICIADETKFVDTLGSFSLPVEVIPMARSFVARELVKLGATPVHRHGYLTDNGGEILDLQDFMIPNPQEIEQTINGITGVISNGLFAVKPADILLLASANGVKKLMAC